MSVHNTQYSPAPAQSVAGLASLFIHFKNDSANADDPLVENKKRVGSTARIGAGAPRAVMATLRRNAGAI